MSRRERESALARMLAGGMIGAFAGALVGLVLFGGVLFLPALTMGLGAGIGIFVATDERDRTVAPVRSAHTPKPAPRAGRTAARDGQPAVVAGPARAPAPRRSDLPPIDVNSAGVEDLSRLPGVGRAAAARIVEHRERCGRFASLRELEAVEGFDMARVARLSARATLSAPDTEPAGEPVLQA